MASKNWQAGGKILSSALAALCPLAMPFGRSWAASGDFAPPSYIGSMDPHFVWELLIGGIVVVSFLAAVALWVMSALRNVRRSQLRRNAFISSALNNLSQGVVMTDAQKRVVFCNDRYLEIYGMTRSDIRNDMTGPDLLALRRKLGVLDMSTDDFYRVAGTGEGLITELADGRSIAVKYWGLPNGGSVATHEDCSEQRRLSRQLATTTQFLESVIDNVPVCVAAKSIEDGRYILANRAFEKFSRLSRKQIVGKRADEIFKPATAATIAAADRAAIQSPDSQFRNEIMVERGPETRMLASNRVIARDDKGQPKFLIALFDDVTDHKSLSRELENTKKFLELIVDNIPVSLIVERVSDGKYLLANRSAETILNRRREDATGLTAADIFNAREAKLIVARDEAAIKKKGMLTEEHPISTKDGLRLFLTRRVTVLDDCGEPQYLIKTHEDVTDRRQTESRMAHMAYHDGLTDVPNRAAFLQALAQMIEACADTDEQFAVLSVDLDGLKEINDVFGHSVGDKLLIEVSRRVQDSARGGVIARLSGDEFGLLIDGTQPEAGRALAEKVAGALASGFVIDGKSVRIGVTTGISIFPRDGADAASLLSNTTNAPEHSCCSGWLSNRIRWSGNAWWRMTTSASDARRRSGLVRQPARIGPHRDPLGGDPIGPRERDADKLKGQRSTDWVATSDGTPEARSGATTSGPGPIEMRASARRCRRRAKAWSASARSGSTPPATISGPDRPRRDPPVRRFDDGALRYPEWRDRHGKAHIAAPFCGDPIGDPPEAARARWLPDGADSARSSPSASLS